jgi:hypothetical protein
MTVQEALAFIKENASDPEVVKYLGEQTVSPEKTTEIIEAYKKSNELKTLIQSESDRRVNKEREKILKEDVPKLVEDAYKKAHPDETTEQKRIRELEAKFESSEKEKGLIEFKSQAFSTLSGLGIEAKEIDLILKKRSFNDIEDLTEYSQNYLALQTEKVMKGVAEKIKASGSNPPNPRNTAAPTGKITSREELKGMKPEDIMAAQRAGRIDIPGINLTELKEA